MVLIDIIQHKHNTKQIALKKNACYHALLLR